LFITVEYRAGTVCGEVLVTLITTHLLHAITW